MVTVKSGSLTDSGEPAENFDAGEILVVTAAEKDWLDVKMTGERDAAGRVQLDLVIPLADSLELFDDLIETHPREGKYLRRRGLAHNARGKPDAALRDFRAAVSLNASDYRAHAGVGMMLRHLKDFDGAIKALDEALRLNGDYPSGFSQRAYAYQDRQEWAKAAEDWGEFIRLEPDNYWGYLKRGDIRQYLRQYGDAIEDLSKAIELRPDLSTAYRLRGVSYRGRYKLAEAVTDFRKAIALAPGDAVAQFDLAYTLGQQTKYEEAVAEYTKYIKLKSQDANGFNNRGWAWESMGHSENAVADYTRGLELAPTSTMMLTSRARVLTKLKRIDEAISDYEQVKRLSPNDGNSYQSLIEIFEAERKWRQAIANYDGLIKIQSGNTVLYLRRATAWARAGDVQQALDYCRQEAEKHGPDSLIPAGLLDLEARIALDAGAGDDDKAHETIVLATRACANGRWKNVDHLVTLAAAYAAADRFEAAAKWMEMAMELAPLSKQDKLAAKLAQVRDRQSISPW